MPTKIEWTDETWNPITGCSVVSPGCTNCYAMKLAGGRLKNHPSRAGLTQDSKAGPVWTGEVRLNEAWLDQPLRWRRPRMIFVCAHGDLFHEAVPDEWIKRVWGVMEDAHWHTFQVLTKRPERAQQWLEDVYWSGKPLPNVWLGVSGENHKLTFQRAYYLRRTLAAVRFLSLEPLLGSVDLVAGGWSLLEALVSPSRERLPGVNWIIVGGESGPGARPMHPDWVRAIRDQCVAAGVPFFFKQWGNHMPWAPVNGRPPSHIIRVPIQPGSETTQDMVHVPKAIAGRLLDGRTWDEMP